MAGRVAESLARAEARLLALGGVEALGRHIDCGGGASLYFLEAGRGWPVVLLHGGGGGGANWYRLIAPLAEHFRVLAPDFPGFGRSPAVRPRAPLGEQAGRLLVAWLDALGVERCDVVGTSFGGLAALWLARSVPARLRRLVLVDVAGLGPQAPWLVRLATLPPFASVAFRPSRRGTAWLLGSLMTAPGSRIGGAHREALIEYLWHSARAGDPLEMTRALRLFTGARGQREVLGDAELAQVQAPVLVVWGERDAFLPASHAARATATIPRAVLHTIPHAGHSPNWETPEELLRVVLPFLRTDAPAA